MMSIPSADGIAASQRDPPVGNISLPTVSIYHVITQRGIYGKCLCEGDLQRERVGYTTMEQWAPVVLFFVGLAVTAAAGSLGITCNDTISVGLDVMFTSEMLLYCCFSLCVQDIQLIQRKA